MTIGIDIDVEHALMRRRGQAKGDELIFPCINEGGHKNGDSSPSASWNRRKGVWNCLGCGTNGTTNGLAVALGIRVETLQEAAEARRMVATYDYHDERGNVLFRKVRYEPKDFSLQHHNGTDWKAGIKGIRRILYRAHDLARAGNGLVFLCEGEKDADNVIAAGLLATTWVEGAQKRPKPTAPIPKQRWGPEYTAMLAGFNVVILPDNDDAGYCAGEWLAKDLLGTAHTVKVLRLPDLPDKGDVSDWLAGGGKADQLLALADTCPLWSEAAEPQDITAFPLSHAGNAEVLAHLYGDRLRYDHALGRWLVWDRHRWLPDPDGELTRLAIAAARERQRSAASEENRSRSDAIWAWGRSSESSGNIDSTLKIGKATPGIADKGLGWDTNPMLLGCQNGVVNLITGVHRAGEPGDRITMSTRLTFDPGATCPRWEQFIREVFIDDDVIRFIQRAVGYSLTGSAREQVWFLCHGGGSNGKSVFTDIIMRLLGDYGGDTPSETLCAKGGFGSGSEASPAIASLKGKRFIQCTETEEMAKINAGRVKWLVGGNMLTARHLHKDFITFDAELKLWLTTNHLPKVTDDSDGYWRRVRLISFAQKFEGANRDLHLDEVLKKEMPGILNWGIRGAVEWNRDGLYPPTSVMLATQTYRDKSDVLADFISDCCVIAKGAKLTPAAAVAAYTQWATSQGVSTREQLTSGTLGTRLSDKWPRRKVGSMRFYDGIGLRTVIDGTPSVPPSESNGTLDIFAPSDFESPSSREETFRNGVQGVPSVPEDENDEDLPDWAKE